MSRFIRAMLAGVLLCAPAAVFAAEKSGEHKSGEHKSGEKHHAHIGEDVSKDVEKPEEFKSDLAIYTFLVFVLLVGILWKFAWGPISSGLDKREEGVRKNIADAEAARVKAEQMLADHQAKLSAVQEEVREILAEARRDAEYTKQEIVNAANKEAEATKNRSIAEIQRARDAALKDLFDSVSEQVATATEYVIGRQMTDADQDRLIQEALSQFSQRS